MKKPSSEWAAIKGVIVLDPDGWDRSRFKESWNESITEFEFERRVSRSTVRWVEDEDRPGPRFNVTSIEDWPRKAKPDGLVYRLECSRAFSDLEGLVPTNGGGEFDEQKPTITYPTGTYHYISGIAKKLNDIQTNAGDLPTWVFFPDLLHEATEAIAA